LRRESPVSLVEPNEGIPYWAVTKLEDIIHISMQPEKFTNRPCFKASVGNQKIAQDRTL